MHNFKNCYNVLTKDEKILKKLLFTISISTFTYIFLIHIFYLYIFVKMDQLVNYQ